MMTKVELTKTVLMSNQTLTAAKGLFRHHTPAASEGQNQRTSILVASPPFTMGTVLPACILYWPIEWPFRFLIGLTGMWGQERSR